MGDAVLEGVGVGVEVGGIVGVEVGGVVGGVVGVEVGEAVEVGVEVGEAVEAGGVGVGAGVGVGFGVGAAVAGGSVGFGVGTAVGAGVAGGGASSVTVNTADAVRASVTAGLVDGPNFAGASDAVASAASVCRPIAPEGTRIVTLNAPAPLTDAEGKSVSEPSHVSWILLFAGKLRPTTATDVPAAPREGEAVRVGVVADVDVDGMVYAAATRIMTPVAARSRHGVRFDARAGVTSGTQRVPSQNDMGGSIRRPG
jgi:hypothetical protein